MNFEFQSFDDPPACFLDIARLSTAMFVLTFDIGFRVKGDEDGDMETRIISLETKGAIIFRYFFHSPSPQPFTSLFTSQSFSGDLYSTTLAELKRHILGVCDLPKDKVKVASIATSITSLYFSTTHFYFPRKMKKGKKKEKINKKKFKQFQAGAGLLP